MNHRMPRILCVDDEPLNISLLQAILLPRGYEVVIAANGQEALDKISAGRIDLCLLDVMMPGMDGFEVCRSIKSDERYRNIPVVMITSYSDKDNRIKGIEAGAEDFISKPFDHAEVLARIKRLLYVKQLSDKLEAANIELEAFNYSVSHDLRSPLTVITGYVQLVSEVYGSGLNAECKSYLHKVQEGAMRMGRLIDTMLNFSSVSRTLLHHAKVDLTGIASDVAMELNVSAQEQRITFNIAEGVVADGDADLLRIVLANLIGNAWKHSGGQEGTVIEFGENEAEGKKVYFVRDNGQGFENSRANTLFIPFQRIPGTIAAGHGIGLATVERIVKRHGGRIWAESEPTKGATFLFTLV